MLYGAHVEGALGYRKCSWIFDITAVQEMLENQRAFVDGVACRTMTKFGSKSEGIRHSVS